MEHEEDSRGSLWSDAWQRQGLCRLVALEPPVQKEHRVGRGSDPRLAQLTGPRLPCREMAKGVWMRSGTEVWVKGKTLLLGRGCQTSSTAEEELSA